MRVLITGFGPFPGAPFNPSAALAKALACRRRPALAGIERSTYVFATTYASVDRELPKLFAQKQKPDVVLMFGVAGRRRQLCIETRACNAVSLLFPDAAGHRPRHWNTCAALGRWCNSFISRRSAPSRCRGDAQKGRRRSANF